MFFKKIKTSLSNPYHSVVACEEGPGIFAKAISLGSLLLVIFSLPLSLFFVVKVVQVSHRFLISFCFTLNCLKRIKALSHLLTTTFTRISKSSQNLRKPVRSSLVSFQLEKYVPCSRKVTGQENTFITF